MQPTSGAVRAANRTRIVRVLRTVGWATRAELVEHTGLSRATVSSVVGELGERGLVIERFAACTGSRGRPAAQVGLDKSAGTAIAIDIGTRHIAVAVGDLSHSVLAERWTATPRRHTAAGGRRVVLDSIEQALAQAEVDTEALVGAALSIAAPVAAGGESLAVPDVLPGWTGSAVADLVAERWGIPVVTENDANLGALAESLRDPVGDGGGVLYVKLASRIGVGMARGSTILRGRHGYAGELGHVTSRARGGRCWCGRRGCLELYAGGDGMLGRLTSPGAPRDIAQLVEQASRPGPVRDVVTDGVGRLARALADLVLVLDPARVVLGGELTALDPELLEIPIRAELGSLPFVSGVDLTVSPLGGRASLVGALNLVFTEPARFLDHSHGPRPGTTSRPARRPPVPSPVPAHPGARP